MSSTIQDLISLIRKQRDRPLTYYDINVFSEYIMHSCSKSSAIEFNLIPGGWYSIGIYKMCSKMIIDQHILSQAHFSLRSMYQYILRIENLNHRPQMTSALSRRYIHITHCYCQRKKAETSSNYPSTIDFHYITHSMIPNHNNSIQTSKQGGNFIRLLA